MPARINYPPQDAPPLTTPPHLRCSRRLIVDLARLVQKGRRSGIDKRRPMRIVCVHQGYELYGSDRCFIDSVAALREAWPQADIEVVLPREGPIAAPLRALASRVEHRAAVHPAPARIAEAARDRAAPAAARAVARDAPHARRRSRLRQHHDGRGLSDRGALLRGEDDRARPRNPGRPQARGVPRAC